MLRTRSGATVKRRLRKVGGIPVFKLPPARLGPVVLALRAHQFDRDGFRLAVMELFAADKEEKSVFRGMAIPTLRALGLLLGFESELRLSSDGALVAAGEEARSKEPMAQILREIELELELRAVWTSRAQPMVAVVDELCRLDQAEGAIVAETRRRVGRWLSYLEFFEVVTRTNDKYRRLPTRRDMSLSADEFGRRLVAAYRALSPKTIGEPSVSIDDVARVVALRSLDEGIVVTRRTFDELLGDCISRGRVSVHLHRSMGAGQRLFRWHEGTYESLSIRREA